MTLRSGHHWTEDAPAGAPSASPCLELGKERGAETGQDWLTSLVKRMEPGPHLVRNISAGSMLTDAIRPTWRISLAIILSFSKFTRPSTLESLPVGLRGKRESYQLQTSNCSMKVRSGGLREKAAPLSWTLISLSQNVTFTLKIGKDSSLFVKT